MLKQQTGRSPSMGKAVMKGISTAMVLAFLGAAVLAKLLDMEVLPMEKVGYGILLIHLLAVFIGTKSAKDGAGKEGAMAAAVTAAGYYLILLTVNALFFGGGYAGLGFTALLVTGSTAATILTGRKGRRKRYKISK